MEQLNLSLIRSDNVMSERQRNEQDDTTFGYPIEEVKTSATDSLDAITQGIMDNMEEDVNELMNPAPQEDS